MGQGCDLAWKEEWTERQSVLSEQPEQPRYPQGYVRSSPSPLTGKGQLGGDVNDKGAPGAAGMLVRAAVGQVSQEHVLCGGHVGGGGAYPALHRPMTWISQLLHLQPWLGVLGAETCPL